MSVLDLFAGVGWAVALRALGIEEDGVELMPEARATRGAAGFRTVHGDVWTYDYQQGSHEGIIASPPCQSFSVAGKGAGRAALEAVLKAVEAGDYLSIDLLRVLADRTDPRTALVLMPLHAVSVVLPEWVCFEQVSAALPVWEACAVEMHRWGYSVWTGNLQAEMYGVPQTRKRAFLIASRTHEVKTPEPTHSRYYPRDPARLDPDVLPWVPMANPLGWGLESRPSPTVTGGGTETGGAEPINNLKRWWPQGSVRVTVAEAGVLQGFPADFPWRGTKGKRYLQAGNAVPPPLAAHVIRAAMGA